MENEIVLCDECNPAVVNDDWTHLDVDHDEETADAEMGRITAQLELYGWLTPIRDADQPGYFTCDVCWGTQCGGGHLFSAEKGN